MALAAQVLAGGGEMGALMRALDWSATPVGPVERWPQSLRTTLGILLASGYPMYVAWGDAYVQFYNDAYRPILGATKHPAALGRSSRETWSEIWDFLGAEFDRVRSSGEETSGKDQLFLLHRNGYLEETYFDYSYSPVHDESGGPGGVLCTCTETTERVLGERRLRTLSRLAGNTGKAASDVEACELAALALAGNPADIPFALIYLVDDAGRTLRLAAAAGLQAGSPAALVSVSLQDDAGGWPFHEVVASWRPFLVEDAGRRFDTLPGGPWPEPAAAALLLPLVQPSHERLAGVLVAGISPRRAFDGGYRSFFELLGGHVAAAIAGARAYEEERRRAEALAELDRAKTAFFSNVSHEFRTPLTLLLGPLDDALGDTVNRLPPAQRERLEIARRNGLRLLKLVNTLLDFSRIEAGRIEAVYEPTDLGSCTAEIAAVFRSAAERAGLEFRVECPQLSQPAYIDREMWEKVIFNLLSNALKFTFNGHIAVRLREVAGRAELQVEDTGIGIAPDDLPRIFDRFHRGRRVRARTHEGSGIGLALVQELVKLHGGSVSAASTPGQGTTFTVNLPLGAEHLPADRIGAGRLLESTALGASPYLEEALRWLPAPADAPSPPQHDASTLPARPSAAAGPEPRVLVADDNADMRDYLRRLLGEHWPVDVAADGESALALARERLPDLVLADIMMPGLDGFQLVQALRADPRTRDIPIVLLSARAGDEAKAEGLDAGADDYMVKPFSAVELLARVRGQLERAELRKRTAEIERRARMEAEAAVRAREEFLSIASHELRNPVALIKASSQVLLRSMSRGEVSLERLEEALRTVEETATRLSNLTSDLLDVSRLQSGGLQLHLEQTDLAELLRRLVEESAGAPPGAHRLTLEVEGGRALVVADSARLEQVFSNLILNAMKYSPDGGEIAVLLRNDATGATVAVRDQGIGLPPDALEAIFQPFGRAANAVASHVPGMGLGLYISRTIVEAHKGRIWAESPGEGLGTSVFVWLPRTA